MDYRKYLELIHLFLFCLSLFEVHAQIFDQNQKQYQASKNTQILDNQQKQTQMHNQRNLKTDSTKCQCFELTVQHECITLGCAWISIGASTQCQTYTISCMETNQNECDDLPDCAWNQFDRCALFTQCEDYTVQKAGTCSQKSYTCSDGKQNANGTIQCDRATCSSLTQSTCKGQQFENRICHYYNNICSAFDISSCSSIIIQEICENMQCKWSGSTCSAKKCDDFKDATSCTFVKNNDLKSINYCTYKDKACQNFLDTLSLTQTNCLANTAGTFHWYGNACQECNGMLIQSEATPSEFSQSETQNNGQFDLQSQNSSDLLIIIYCFVVITM